MLEPSIDKLLNIANSKYYLVVVSAKRAKDLDQGAKCLLDHPKSISNVGRALEEVIEGKIIIK